MNFEYIKNCQHNDELLKSYFTFTQTIFEFDLAEWNNAGFWGDRYIPHSLVCNNQVIANISASIMQHQIKGNNVSAVQLGSVGVLPEYRGQGLARILMEKVLEEYKHFPLIYLYAEEDARGYYQKLGFRPVTENFPLFKVPQGQCVKRSEPVRITIESEHLKRLLNGELQHSSIFDARGNTSIYWFHLLYRFSQNIYYIPEKDCIFLARYNNSSVEIFDVLSENQITFDEIQEYILAADTQQVRFHFTPDWLGLNYEVSSNNMDDLYVRGEFPEDLGPFKYPATAQT